MRLEHLRAFTTLAEELHFRRAAARLYVSQPTLTAQIHGLERSLGLPLFSRDREGTRLTVHGARLLGPASAVLAAVSELEAASRQTFRQHRRYRVGLLQDGVGTATWLALDAFHRSHPNLEIAIVRVSFSTAATAIRSGLVDALLLRGPWDEDSPEYVTTVGQAPVDVLIPCTHELAAQPRLTLDDVVPRLRFVPPPEMGESFRRFWTQESHHLARDPDERMPDDDATEMAQAASQAGAIGLWPGDLRVPESTGAVIRRLADDIRFPLQLVARDRGAEQRGLADALRRTIALNAPDNGRTDQES